MAKYTYNLQNDKDLQRFQDNMLSLTKVFETMEFKEFIADKCLKELDDIQSYSLSTYEETNLDIHKYRYGHVVEIADDYILIFNDTKVEQGEMWWVNEKTRENYPNGISIAKLVEYGTGVRGTDTPEDGWATDVNNHGEKGWVYRNPNTNNFTWTNGTEGRFIYLKLLDAIKKNFGSWYEEYLRKVMK